MLMCGLPAVAGQNSCCLRGLRAMTGEREDATCDMWTFCDVVKALIVCILVCHFSCKLGSCQTDSLQHTT